MLTDKFKIQFIQFLSRLFKEGDFSATYKFAFLNALADICVERPLEERLVITTRQITKKMIELYWAQSRPFSGSDKFILQNAGKQSAIITKIVQLQSSGYSLGGFRKEKEEFNKFVTSLVPTVVNGPLWRLQILSEKTEEFLFLKHGGNRSIQMKAGIQECFHIFYDLVISLTRDRWQQKIRSIPYNFELVGKKGDLESFLFGTQRKSLKKAEIVLNDIQKGRCFYCEKPLKNSKAVDHFIPWSRYPYDLGHNFVLAHETCNSKKSDKLASKESFDKWRYQNTDIHVEEITERLIPYFLCDSSRSVAIANWAYAAIN